MKLRSNAPEVKWILANVTKGNDFALSCDRMLLKSGVLTENMFAGVQKAIARDAERVARTVAAADVSGVSHVVEAFSRAVASGLKRPKMYLGDFVFKLAPEGGRNAGAIYVTEEGEYLGKIADGKFVASRECTDAQKAAIVEVCADPKKAAEAYGQETGRCSCCGRELTDPVSIANNIGPICAERFGF
jgi:hypothetical protein